MKPIYLAAAVPPRAIWPASYRSRSKNSVKRVPPALFSRPDADLRDVGFIARNPGVPSMGDVVHRRPHPEARSESEQHRIVVIDQGRRIRCGY